MLSERAERTKPVRRLARMEILTEIGVCPAPGCGDEFTPRYSEQAFCSNACRQAAHRERHRQSKTFHGERNAG